MGSRYDIAVFRGVTLAQFAQAFHEHGTVGAEVPGPLTDPVTIAQIDTASGSNVVVLGPPMGTPDGVDTLLAKNLGAEVLFAMVWDIVSTYNLHVVGDGVNRSIEAEPSEDDLDDEGFGTMLVYSRGDRLPEEPDWPESDLSEAYVQVVFSRRCGIDPGNLQDYDVPWYALDPRPDPEERPTSDDPPEPPPAAEPPAGRPGGLWSRVKRLFNG